MAGLRITRLLYVWLVSDGVTFKLGFLVDELSATMMLVVSFVSWMVHIYTIGYMREDSGLPALLQLHLLYSRSPC